MPEKGFIKTSFVSSVGIPKRLNNGETSFVTVFDKPLTSNSSVKTKMLTRYGKMLMANNFMSLNISANILGMSGATTPMGIKSIQELEKHKGTEYAIAMFFVINATSVQLIPSSVLALRTSMGSISPSSIILPTILATLLSTIIGVILVKIFIKKGEK